MINTKKVVLSLLSCAVILIGCNSQKKIDQSLLSSQKKSPFQAFVTKTPTVLPTSIPTYNPVAAVGTLVPMIESDDTKILQNFDSIFAAFNQQIKTTNWIRMVSTKRTFSERTQTYTDWGTFEEWFRFDVDGKYVEGYNWISGSNGTIEQESCFQNGKIFNVTNKSFNKGDIPSRIDFTGGFANAFEKGNNISQDQVDYQGTDAWKFTYEMEDGTLDFLHAIYFDRLTNLILGKETWLKQDDGTTRLVSSMVVNIFEVNADPPLGHFQQISSQIPK